MEKNKMEEIFSLFNFNESSLDIALKFFSIKTLTNNVLNNYHEINNILAFLINTKHVLYEDSDWSISNENKQMRYQIKDLISKIYEYDSNNKVFTKTRIYGFNRNLILLGDESCLKETESFEGLFKKITVNSRINYCDAQKNLSLFYNEISSFIESNIPNNSNNKTFLRLVLLTGYNDTSINIELFNSILKTFESGRIIINLNLILLENDYYTSNYLKDQILNFLEYKNELNPSKDPEILKHLLSNFQDDSLETKFQIKSREIVQTSKESFANEKVLNFLDNFEKKMMNLIDMNDVINSNIKGCNVKETESNSKNNLENIISGDNYLDKVISNITSYLKSEEYKNVVLGIIDHLIKKFEDFNEWIKEIKSEIVKKNLSCFYWDEKIKHIENQYNTSINLAKKIKNLKEFVNVAHEIIVDRIKDKIQKKK